MADELRLDGDPQIGVIAFAAPAFAEEPRSLVRQIVVMWFPLLLFLSIWVFFIRRMGAGKQREALERSIPHMDALERKLDRIIELLEEQANRR